MTEKPNDPLSSVRLEEIKVYMLEQRNVPVLNISQGGIAVQTQKPLTIGREYIFHLRCGIRSVALGGRVIRCNLNEIAESSSGNQLTLYVSGIEFLVERNPKEITLLTIIQEHMYGEKRVGPARIVPIKKMTVDVGIPSLVKLVEIDPEGFTVESNELPDMDEIWPAMVEIRSYLLDVDCRIIQVSKKTDSDIFQMRMEFLKPGPEITTFLKKITQSPSR